MSVAFVVAVFGWFPGAIAAYTGAPVPLAWGLLVVAAPLVEPELVTVALARHLARGRGAGRTATALLTACVWVATEWVFPKLFGDTLGHGFLASRLLRQAADVAGAPGLTFVLVLANEGVLGAVGAARRRDGRAALAAAAAVVLPLVALAAYGTIRLHQLADGPDSEARLVVGLVQADVAGYDRLAAERGTFETVRLVLDRHFALSRDALARGAVDVLVWPETVYPTTFGTPKSEAGAAFDHEIAHFVSATQVPLVFGAYDAEAGAEFNAAVVLAPEGEGRVDFDTYRKAALFPLTERVPAVVDSAWLRRWLPWLGTWAAGAGGEAVPITLRDGRTVRIAPLICYDALVPRLAIAAVRRGAEVIVTLSNDSWFADGLGPRLHLVVSAFRSLETRRPQVRATNTGISAVIDATGEVRAQAGVHERTALVATIVPETRATTLVLAWGDWLGPVALGLPLVLLAAARALTALSGRRGRGPCW